jgi:NTE family protein
MLLDNKFALALAGGGTRGAYQVGACKALNEAGIEIQAVTGTSIGAINGALIVQKDLELLDSLYNAIEPEQIIDTDLNLDFDKDIFHISNFFKMSGEFIKHGGYKSTPLRKLLEDNVNIEKIYSSEIDYGVVTFELDSIRAVEKFKEDIPHEQMLDFILASASMPIFRAQRIEKKKFTDGGIADNLPVNMLSSKGYKRIIAVDLHGIGVVPPLRENDTYIKTIRPTVSLGGLMEFNKERMRKNKKMGYMDTLKSFSKLQGNIYFFQPGEYKRLMDIFNTGTIASLELAAEVFEMEKYEIRGSDDFLKELNDKYIDEKNASKEKINIFNLKDLAGEIDKLMKLSSRKRILINIVEQARTSPLHTAGIENAIFKDLEKAAQAILELEQYMKSK